ncbi:MAG: hypothetical protein EXS22_08715 [Pedosphaera sp.]|nr:hypothetical protein [Pedosphaera sp.]
MPHVDTPQSRCRFALEHADITPPANIYHRMWGAATHERATGIHRPLRATVALFAPHDDTSTERQFVIALDHCVMGRVEMDTLLNTACARADVPRAQCIVVFSHTHAAGLMGLERANLPGGDLIAPYLDTLAECVGDLLSQTLAQLQPASIVYGTGRCSLAAHRDFWDAQHNLFACGFNPSVPADDTLLTARVTGEHGDTLATLVNYACHPTTLAWGNTLISPDFPGAMREVIEEATGAPCLFLQGASGELGPREGFVGNVAVADRHGRQLGYAALATLEELPAPGTRFDYAGPVVSGATIATWQHVALTPAQLRDHEHWTRKAWDIPLPIRPGTPTLPQVQAELAEWSAKETAAHAAGQPDAARDARAMAERKRRMFHRLQQLPPGDHLPLEATVLRLGDAVWVILQGEFYSALQTQLRARFPGVPIVVATIASHWGASYLPPRELYGKGIYQETIAIVAAGSLETVIELVGQEIRRQLPT